MGTSLRGLQVLRGEDQHFVEFDDGTVYREWGPLVSRAGLDDFTPHDCRHTYATWLRIYAKLGTQALKRAGGWADLRSVERYAHVTSEEVREAIDSLPGRAESGQSEKKRRRDSAL